MSRTPANRDILDAAIRVVARDGMAALTVEAVAREAGLSKGGVLHHYRTKDSLVEGLVGHLIAQQDEAVRVHERADSDTVGRRMRAYLSTALPRPADAPNDGLTAEEARRLHLGLLSAAVVYPGSLTAAREWAARLRRAVSADGLDPTDQFVTLLAADGFWLWDLFGLLPEDPSVRDEIVARLHARTRRTGTAGHPPTTSGGST